MTVRFWLVLKVLEFAVNWFGWTFDLILHFWGLWSCVFGGLIDLIWSFGIYGHVFLGFWLTWFGVWEFTVKNLPGFFDCIWDFWICSQQSSLFLMTYIEILQYEVNLSLCFAGLFWFFAIYSQLKPAVCVTSPGFAFTMRHHPPYHRAFPVWRKPPIF